MIFKQRWQGELVMNSNNFWIMLLREVLKTVVFIECYAISAGSKFRGEESWHLLLTKVMCPFKEGVRRMLQLWCMYFGLDQSFLCFKSVFCVAGNTTNETLVNFSLSRYFRPKLDCISFEWQSKQEVISLNPIVLKFQRILFSF